MEGGNQSMKTEPGFDSERKMEAVERLQTDISPGIYRLNPIKIEQEINLNLSFEEKLLSLEKEIVVLKEQKLSDGQLITKLTELLESEDNVRESHVVAECGLKELRVCVSNLKAEKKAADLAMEELRRENEMLKESEQKSYEKLLELEKVIDILRRRGFLDHQAMENERSEFLIREKNLNERLAKAEEDLEEVKGIVGDLECEKRGAELIIEELRREKLEGIEIVKDSRERSLKAVEANIRRLDEFSKLLKMNMDDLVEMKNTLVGEEDTSNEIGMTAEDCDSKRGLKRKRSGVFGAEIVRAFQEDDELCIQAVRELHRQVLNSECSNISSFYHFEQLWRYDPEVKRPIAEIKQRFPHIVGLCRQLAMEYSSYLVAMPSDGDALSVSMVCRRCYMLGDSHDSGRNLKSLMRYNIYGWILPFNSNVPSEVISQERMKSKKGKKMKKKRLKNTGESTSKGNTIDEQRMDEVVHADEQGLYEENPVEEKEIANENPVVGNVRIGQTLTWSKESFVAKDS